MSRRESKIKKLFETSMEQGGLPAFRANWEQSIGIVTNEDGNKVLDNSKKEIDYKDFEIGRVCQTLMGNDWRNTFEQNWQAASRLRFESGGGTILPGSLPYVSAAIDTVAGLANARALDRPSAPQFIWDSLCSVQEAVGEGGYDVIIRPAGTKPSTDLADGQQLPTTQLKGSRVHRKRTKNQGLRTKVNLYTVLDDLTGTLYQAIDEVSDQVLNERERKVIDCLCGIYDPQNEGVIYVEQDGQQFFPYQYAVGTTPAPDNGVVVQNYKNACISTGDTYGLGDYTCVERAFTMLYGNKDPFTGLPVDIGLNGMKFIVAPRSFIQAKYIMNAREVWQGNSAGITAAYGKNTIAANPLDGMGFSILTSQIMANRLSGVGISQYNALTTALQMTDNAADTFSTADSLASFFLMGHPEKAIKYLQRQPYTVQQVPLGSTEYGEQTVLVQDVRERGQAYWVDPRQMVRIFA
jgi:hypothetical protein